MIIATISATCVILDKNDDRKCGFHEEKYIAVLNEYTPGGIFKLLWSPEIDSKESIPPAYVAHGGPVREPYSYLVPGPHRLFKNSSSGVRIIKLWRKQPRRRITVMSSSNV